MWLNDFTNLWTVELASNHPSRSKTWKYDHVYIGNYVQMRSLTLKCWINQSFFCLLSLDHHDSILCRDSDRNACLQYVPLILQNYWEMIHTGNSSPGHGYRNKTFVVLCATGQFYSSLFLCQHELFEDNLIIVTDIYHYNNFAIVPPRVRIASV